MWHGPSVQDRLDVAMQVAYMTEEAVGNVHCRADVSNPQLSWALRKVVKTNQLVRVAPGHQLLQQHNMQSASKPYWDSEYFFGKCYRSATVAQVACST